MHEGAGKETIRTQGWRVKHHTGHSALTDVINIPEEALKFDVNVDTIDNLNLTDVDFIKIDVEGFEINVLEGAEKTLIKNSPVLVIEILSNQVNWDPNTKNKIKHDSTISIKKCLKFLNGLGYGLIDYNDADYVFAKFI